MHAVADAASVETLLRSRLRLHLGDHNAKHGSGRTIRPTQHVERKADVVGGKINRADTIGLSAATREEIASPRDYPGSLPLEAALRNCRRVFRQASERRDPGMTGTLGDCPGGRSQAALAA
jgi:hypothetical protein